MKERDWATFLLDLAVAVIRRWRSAVTNQRICTGTPWPPKEFCISHYLSPMAQFFWLLRIT